MMSGVPTIDPDVLASALKRLGALDPDADLGANLDRLIDDVRSVFASDGAGLMFLDDQSALRYATASDDGARLLEQVQEDIGHGPCVSSLVENDLVASADVQDDARWPLLAARMRGSIVHAVLGIPVRLSGTAIGSLNVYRATAHPWSDDEIHALESFNRLVEMLVGTALLAEHRSTLADQLTSALDTRATIERAIGYVMARRGVDAVDAFDELRRVARSERRKVADLAGEILSGRELPDR